MRIFIGIVFIIVGFFIWVAWMAASHTGINFDPWKLEHWFLALLVAAPFLLGIRILFKPMFKKKEGNDSR